MKTIITEAIDKHNRFLRFVLPATIDFTINQLDIEKVYTYTHYKNDIQAGISEKEILAKLNNLIEDIGIQKFNNLTNNIRDTSIDLQKFPTIHNAQPYRFSLDMVLHDYKELYNLEQESLIDNELDS
jgi:hypothetical protein